MILMIWKILECPLEKIEIPKILYVDPFQPFVAMYVETDAIPQGSKVYPGQEPIQQQEEEFKGVVVETYQGIDCFDPKLESSLDQLW